MSKTLERRRHPRGRLVVPSRIAGTDVSAECETFDLSANGLSCWLDRPLSLFTKVKITLMLPLAQRSGNHRENAQPIECAGVVVRSEPEACPQGTGQYHTAIFFNHIDEQAMEVIQRYVASHKH